MIQIYHEENSLQILKRATFDVYNTQFDCVAGTSYVVVTLSCVVRTTKDQIVNHKRKICSVFE